MWNLTIFYFLFCFISSNSDSYYEREEQIEKKRDLDEADMEFDCSICMDTSLIKYSNHFGCEHRYCKSCLIEFLLSKFETNQVNGITCPTESCEFQAEDKWIRSMLPSNSIENYDKIIFRTIGGQLEDIVIAIQIIIILPILFSFCHRCTVLNVMSP